MATEIAKIEHNLATPAFDRGADYALRIAKNKCWIDGAEWRWYAPIPDRVIETLRRRLVVLREALADHNDNLKAAYIADMLGSYDPRPVPAHEMQMVVQKYLADLANIPTWSVCRACAQIKTGNADGVSPIYRPTTIQLFLLCRQIMAAAMTEAVEIASALAAKPYSSDVADEERATIAVKIKTFAMEFGAGVEEKERLRLRPIQDRFSGRRVERDRAFALREYAEAGFEPVYFGGEVVTLGVARRMGCALVKAKKGKRSRKVAA